jgi:hypothetical protein
MAEAINEGQRMALEVGFAVNDGLLGLAADAENRERESRCAKKQRPADHAKPSKAGKITDLSISAAR